MSRKKKRQPKGATVTSVYINHDDPVLKRYVSDISKYGVPSSEETQCLLAKASAGDGRAKADLINGNCRLPIRIAREFIYSGLDFNDLIQEGNYGLCEAVDKYDPNRNVPFPNYAAWWIKARILKFIYQHQSTVHLPETQRVNIIKLLNVNARFVMEHGRVPTMEELMRLSGLSETTVEDFHTLFGKGESLFMRNIDIMDKQQLPVDDSPAPDAAVDETLLRVSVDGILETLPDEHREFIRDYYGIGRKRVMCKELAARHNCTTECIRQRRVRILDELVWLYEKSMARYLD